MKILKILIGIVLSFSTAFIGIGYAQLSSTISLEATITGSMQKGVFISDVSKTQGVNINTYFSTVLNSEVVLANSNDTKTLTITLYNNSSDNYSFKGVEYDAEITDGYTNENITFTHSLQLNQEIEANKMLEFTITFAFKDGYKATTSESLQSILNFRFELWDGSEILPDDVVGFNHKVLIENILNGTMVDENGNEVKIGMNNPDSELNKQIDDRMTIDGWWDTARYTFGSMDVRDNQEMSNLFGLDASQLSFMIYMPEDEENIRYLYTTSVYLGESGWVLGNDAKPTCPIDERIYPIYRTKLVYKEVEVDENNNHVYEWVAEKTVLGSAKSAYYENDTLGALAVQNPAFDPLSFAPILGEDCESGESPITMGDSMNSAIYIPLGTTVDEVANSTDKTYFKYQALSSGMVKITPTEKSEFLTISVYSNESLTELVVSGTGAQISFDASEMTYYIVATGDTEVNFTIQ